MDHPINPQIVLRSPVKKRLIFYEATKGCVFEKPWSTNVWSTMRPARSYRPSAPPVSHGLARPRTDAPLRERSTSIGLPISLIFVLDAPRSTLFPLRRTGARRGWRVPHFLADGTSRRLLRIRANMGSWLAGTLHDEEGGASVEATATRPGASPCHAACTGGPTVKPNPPTVLRGKR
jgi:hypothetical protein